jgi:hypothetical protein
MRSNFSGMQSENNQEEEEEPVGVYVKAFCSGINELLSVYK